MIVLPDSLTNEAYKMVDASLAESYGDWAKFCGSPIEAIFATACSLLGNFSEPSVIRCLDHTALPEPSVSVEFYVCPQQRIGRYTADFVIGSWLRQELRADLIVECDGHEWHEKTKEQAAHDKARDRALQALGYRVYRFTGSEIYRDPVSVAAECMAEAHRPGSWAEVMKRA